MLSSLLVTFTAMMSLELIVYCTVRLKGIINTVNGSKGRRRKRLNELKWWLRGYMTCQIIIKMSIGKNDSLVCEKDGKNH